MTIARNSTENIIRELDAKAVAKLGRYRATYAAFKEHKDIPFSVAPFANRSEVIMSNKWMNLRLFAFFAVTLSIYILMIREGGAREMIWEEFADRPVPRYFLLSLGVANALAMCGSGLFLVLLMFTFPTNNNDWWDQNQFRNRLTPTAKTDFTQESKSFLHERMQLTRQLSASSIFNDELRACDFRTREVLRLLVDCYSMLAENDPELREITKMLDRDFIYCLDSFYLRHQTPHETYIHLQKEYDEQRVAKRMHIW